ncbi:MAG: metallophosphoesterase family protein [Thermoplasmatota archaeon]
MLRCIFVSDLHGKKEKYTKLFEFIDEDNPDAVLMGGDLLSITMRTKAQVKTFTKKYIFDKIKNLDEPTKFFVILGNDDPKIFEPIFEEADKKELIDYVSCKTLPFDDYFVTGYPYIPPTPFHLKDWEKYDVSRYRDVGVVSPEKGSRTVEIPENEVRYSTITKDLERLGNNSPAEKTIYLFHSPPYSTNLDRADLDDKKIDHVPLDVHVGSIAIKRFIEKKQPLLTLHGHVHETVRLTGEWKEKIGRTHSFTAVHKGTELAIIRFQMEDLDNASREII